MSISLFVVTWIFPVIFVPYEFLKAVFQNLVLHADDEVRQVAKLDAFQVAYNDRMWTRKRDLLNGAMVRAQHELGRSSIRILEIGSGSGANFDYYPPGAVVVCVDPNRKSEGSLRKSAEKYPDMVLEAFYVGRGEDMRAAVEDASVDIVVSTLTLCSVDDVDRCLKEVLRVLRPSGRFVFLEHVAGDGAVLYAMQAALGPMWRYLYGDCRLMRRLDDDILRRAGFSRVDIDRFQADEILQPTPVFRAVALCRPHVAGVAMK